MTTPSRTFPGHHTLQGAGAGLKAEHVGDILRGRPDVGFFEVHAENYMGAGGLPHAQLQAIREQYPISLHGVGMSIGSSGPLNPDHLARFKRLVDIYQPAMVSEHLAWSTHTDVFYNDLLPLPYTDETLAKVVEHVSQMQDTLGRQILLENPSTYVTFSESTWEEGAFMAEIAKRAGCGLLFDVNNVYISATNHKTSAEAYIDSYPLHLVGEIHLAGHAEDADDDGERLLIDAHDRPVHADVWTLYDRVLGHTGALPSLIEWDNDVPAWAVLEDEVKRTQDHLARAAQPQLRHAG
ncbi:MAG: DUF692 domain-containing protein [Pseudomonadota bacterium]